MKKLLIILIVVISIALPNFASEDNLIYNSKTQQWEYNFNEIKFEYDDYGKLQKIGDMKVTYLENGQMDYIGDMKVKYFKNGKIKSVGKHWFNYNANDKLVSINHIGLASYNRWTYYNRWDKLESVGDYHIEYEYIYPYGYRIKQLVKY